jgi:phosphoglycerol geranylgeranyltransferase
MKFGPVEGRLRQAVEKSGAAHLTLIDPDSQEPVVAGEIARAAVDGGTDGIMVGGSVGASGTLLLNTVSEIKRCVDLPVILFPSSPAGLCEGADAVFFMSLLNSRSTAYLIDSQALGAPLVVRYRLEPIPMAYIVIEPGATVGWVGDARLIPREKPDIAAAYALAGKFLGMRLVYLEAGSGAGMPLPVEMVRRVSRVLGETQLIVGGGIRDGRTAAELARAGAKVIVTGTGVEQSGDVASFVGEITGAIREVGQDR